MADNHGFPTPKDILEIHDEIEKEYELEYTGVRVAAPKLKLKRLLDRVDEHEGTYTKAAALLRDLITSHFFEDANKRTAWTTTVLYLEDYGLKPAVRGKEVERILRRIRRYDIEEIAEWLECGTIDRDRLEP